MQMYLEMKAKEDPISFVKHPYFLGRNPYPMQEQIFTEFYKNPKIILLVVIAGMRGGKTRLAADLVCYEAFTLLSTPNIYAQYGLEKDSKFYIMCVATSEDQAADTIYAAVKSSISGSPFFQKYGAECYSNEIRFPKYPVEIKAGLSSALALVGRTVKCNVFDELDRLERTEGKRSAELVFASLSKSTTSFQFAGKNIVITSPLYTESKASTLYEQNKENPYAQVYRLPTWELNPNLPFDGEFLQAKLKEDPITFWRDYGAIPQASVDRFYKDDSILKFDEEIKNVFESGEAWNYWRVRQRTNPVKLVLGADPAGTMDSFGLALGYKDPNSNEYYIIGVKRYEPQQVDRQMVKKLGKRVAMEINPLDVKKDILTTVNELRVKTFVSDTWQYPELQKELQLGGIPVFNNLIKLEHYEVLRKLQYAGQFHCCYNAKLLDEWRNLVQLNAKHVDHPKGGSKDIADSVCNVIWTLDSVVPVAWAPPLMAPFSH